MIRAYGKVLIYKAKLNPNKNYLMSIFDRQSGKWVELCSVGCISEHFELINKKDLFLELL